MFLAELPVNTRPLAVKFGGVENDTQVFDWARDQCCNSCVVQGSTVFCLCIFKNISSRTNHSGVPLPFSQCLLVAGLGFRMQAVIGASYSCVSLVSTLRAVERMPSELGHWILHGQLRSASTKLLKFSGFTSSTEGWDMVGLLRDN